MAASNIFELHVRVVEAKGLPIVVKFGKQDPYVVVSCRNEVRKSNVHTDAHVCTIFISSTAIYILFGFV